MTDFPIQIVSDLHTEIDPKGVIEELVPACPHVALCGDIGRVGNHFYEDVIAHCAGKFQRTFVVLGNHEYYNGKVSTVEEQARQICTRYPSVHLLNRGEVRFEWMNQPMRVLGCTLWSHVPKDAEIQVEQFLNDYRVIYKRHFADGDNKIERIEVADTNYFHQRDVQWLSDRLNEDPKTPTIVFTHHAPLSKGVSNPRYENPPKLTNHAFCTDLSYMMMPCVRGWAFGHTHHSADFLHQKTRVVTNARGYFGERQKIGYAPTRVFKFPVLPL